MLSLFARVNLFSLCDFAGMYVLMIRRYTVGELKRDNLKMRHPDGGLVRIEERVADRL